ncbi:MAG: hypothetical protein IPK19_04010 [Chloroflexi bacterium]|nr:hypothetical protein [Chloroflexota bacterium]
MYPDSPPVRPLEPLLADASVTAIHIREDGIHYGQAGVLRTSEIRFESDAQRRQIVNAIVRAGGAVLSADHPVADCILTDGTRVHAQYQPLSISLYKA